MQDSLRHSLALFSAPRGSTSLHADDGELAGNEERIEQDEKDNHCQPEEGAYVVTPAV